MVDIFMSQTFLAQSDLATLHTPSYLKMKSKIESFFNSSEPSSKCIKFPTYTHTQMHELHCDDSCVINFFLHYSVMQKCRCIVKGAVSRRRQRYIDW